MLKPELTEVNPTPPPCPNRDSTIVCHVWTGHVERNNRKWRTFRKHVTATERSNVLITTTEANASRIFALEQTNSDETRKAQMEIEYSSTSSYFFIYIQPPFLPSPQPPSLSLSTMMLQNVTFSDQRSQNTRFAFSRAPDSQKAPLDSFETFL